MNVQTQRNCHPTPEPLSLDAERLDAFARALDELRKDVEAELGAPDVAHIERVARLSRRMEQLGRILLQFSVEPVGFSAGVVALWLHKTLELMEIGHTVLHGTYDHVPGAEAFHAIHLLNGRRSALSPVPGS